MSLLPMSLVPEKDPKHQGQDGREATSLLHNIDLPNGASIAEIDEAEQHSYVKDKTNNFLLENDTEFGNETFQLQQQIKILEEKLSVAVVNLNDKEEMVKQHENVATEAVAGWEKALTEVSVLKQQIVAANEEKLVAENRAKQLDEALKECVKQLRQVREEHNQKIQEAVIRKTREWDLTRSDLESQLLQLQAAVHSSKFDSDLCKLQYLENENSALKIELASQSEELEVRTIERDLNAHAAETASKQRLGDIRKLAKLEAENRNLRSVIGKSSSIADHKSVSVSSLCVESLTDSQSDCGELMNAMDVNIVKMGINECEPSCSDSWTSASFAELDNLKKQKAVNRTLANLATEIDLMDDFLEIEHLAALPANEPPKVPDQAIGEPCSPRDLYEQTYELQEKLERVAAEKTQLEDLLEKIRDEKSVLGEKVRSLEKLNDALEEQKRNLDLQNNELAGKVAKIEEEKTELDVALVDSTRSVEMLKKQLKDNENALEDIQIELIKANVSKQYYEQQAIGNDFELKTMAAKVDALQEEVTEECARSENLEAECRNLKDALLRQRQEVELELSARVKAELKIKQEELAVTALKLSECQETIMSIVNQLQSLATVEDLLSNGKHSQVTIGGAVIPGHGGEVWKLHSNRVFLAKREAELSDIPAIESNDHAVGFDNSVNGENGEAQIL